MLNKYEARAVPQSINERDRFAIPYGALRALTTSIPTHGLGLSQNSKGSKNGAIHRCASGLPSLP
jgi:hypothetical protein